MSKKSGIRNYKELTTELEKIKEAPKKILEYTTKDVRSRGPSWVAQGVVDRYNLEGGKGKGKKAVTGGDLGSLKIDGDLVKGMRLVYEGRRLTPVHFGMKPTLKPQPWSTYTMKWKVLQSGEPKSYKVKKLTKKQQKNIGRNFTHQSTRTSERSPFMLQTTKASSADKIQYIPFQRTKSTDRDMGHAAREVSLPQMVTKGKDGPFHPEIEKVFNENLEKRFHHHAERFMK